MIFFFVYLVIMLKFCASDQEHKKIDNSHEISACSFSNFSREKSASCFCAADRITRNFVHIYAITKSFVPLTKVILPDSRYIGIH